MCDKGAERSEVEWRMDFSSCGLVVNRLEVRARCGWGESEDYQGVSFTIYGDRGAYITPELGGMSMCVFLLSYRFVHMRMHPIGT